MSLNKLKNVNNRNLIKVSEFFIIIFLFLLVMFYKEKNIFLIFKFYFGMIYLFIIPGFIVISMLFKKLSTTERLFLALPFGSALIGLVTFLSYTYFGLKLRTMLYFPLLIILIYTVKRIINKR